MGHELRSRLWRSCVRSTLPTQFTKCLDFSLCCYYTRLSKDFPSQISPYSHLNSFTRQNITSHVQRCETKYNVHNSGPPCWSLLFWNVFVTQVNVIISPDFILRSYYNCYSQSRSLSVECKRAVLRHLLKCLMLLFFLRGHSRNQYCLKSKFS